MCLRIIIRLHGCFSVVTDDGVDITPSGKKERALLAVLATSTGLRRSRVWLRNLLWEDRGDVQAAASLRQMLHSIRKQLGQADHVLQADRHELWLSQESIEVEAPDLPHAETFLEGFDLRGEGFEDWLRAERAEWERTHAHMSRPASVDAPKQTLVEASPVPNKPWGVVLPVWTTQADSLTGRLASFMTAEIVAMIRAWGFVDVLDQSDLASDQLTHQRHTVAHAPHFAVRLIATQIQDDVHITIRIIDPEDNAVIWSHRQSYNEETGGSFPNEQSDMLVARVLTVVHDHVAQKRERIAPCLVSAVHQFFSTSPGGLQTALETFHALKEHSALSNAWIAYALAVSRAERVYSANESLSEEIDHYCAEAIRLDRLNPMVNAIVAQVQMLAFKAVERAGYHHEIAAQASSVPTLALTFRALFLNYGGKQNDAIALARFVQRVDPANPYRFLTLTPMLFGHALNGQHEFAVEVGRQILSERPMFLGAMRHMAGSLALNGDVADARQMITNVRAVDPQFDLAGISDPSYPLPSQHSRELLSAAFSLTQAA